jgi:hypothetical protein
MSNGNKIYQIATKYTKLPQNIPKWHKIYQIAIGTVYQIAIQYVYQIAIKHTKIPRTLINWTDLKYTKIVQYEAF